jgi:putative transposase
VKLDLSRGAIVAAQGRRYQITDNALGFDRVEARDAETGALERLAVVDIQEPEESALTVAPDPSAPDTKDIEEARRRMSVIRPLLELPRRRAADIRAAMAILQVGKTTLYRWMNRLALDGRLTSLQPTPRPGGRGKSRLNPGVESIVQSAIHEHHLKPLQPSVRSTVREIRQRCKNAGLKPPHENTIRARLAAIPEKTMLRRRGQSKKADDRLTAPSA